MYEKVECPSCFGDLQIPISKEGGDIVPWGSTWITTPEGIIAESPDSCEHCGIEFDEFQKLQIEQEACDKFTPPQRGDYVEE